MPRTPTTTLIVLASLCIVPIGAAHGQGARVVSRHAGWTVYAHDAEPRICFATAQPTQSEPAGAKRDPVHFYVSAWPKEGVKSEVSIKLGYPLKKGTPVTVAIGAETFSLFAAGDKAFVSDPTQELKLIDALRKGASMIVQGTSERGTATKDTYSLSGVGQALAAVTGGCG